MIDCDLPRTLESEFDSSSQITPPTTGSSVWLAMGALASISTYL